MKGRKKATEKEGKYKPHLVLPSLIEQVARVREYGVKKYGHEDGWQLTPSIDYLDAAARHLNLTLAAYQEGDRDLLRDEESGLYHLAHAACDIMFVINNLLTCVDFPVPVLAEDYAGITDTETGEEAFEDLKPSFIGDDQ